MLAQILETAQIAFQLAEMVGKINTFIERGAAIQVFNDTGLTFMTRMSGDFFEPPDPRLPAKHTCTFASKGPAGCKGSVTFVATDGFDLAYEISFDVPFAGANEANATRSGGEADYYQSPVTVGSANCAILRFELFEASVEANFKRCTKCASLVLDGAPSPCAGGNTHDFSGSRAYKVVKDPGDQRGEGNWRLCARCRTLTKINDNFGLTAALCHAGGTHDISGSHDYRLVIDDRARGDQARRCLCCQTAVFDLAKACPASLPIMLSTPHVLDPTATTYRIL